MNQILTQGIVLTRTDYGEADRIVTFLTPENGKLRVIARGVRKIRSKSAGGIELFSVSELGYILGRGELGTLTFARLVTHYGHIVQDIERIQVGYELIKLLHKTTEDQLEAEYFYLLQQSFAALNQLSVDLKLIQVWFQAQLLRLSGYSPNLQTDVNNKQLQANMDYNFDFEKMAFVTHSSGAYNADHIKVMRLLFSNETVLLLDRVSNMHAHIILVSPLISAMRSTYLRI